MVRDSFRDYNFMKNNFENNDFYKKLWISKGDIKIWEIKDIPRVVEKNTSKYSWKLNEIWDINRMLIIQDNTEDLALVTSNFIEYAWRISEVKEIRLEDKIWNLFEKAEKNSWYRDAKITLALENGNTIEVQFQLSAFYEIKEKWLEITEDLFNRIKKEISFDENEKNEIINFCKRKSIKLPMIFKEFFDDESILVDNNIFKEQTWYDISRAIFSKSIKNKLQTIWRFLYDTAWLEVAKKEEKRITSK
jgi:hypothetical protein